MTTTFDSDGVNTLAYAGSSFDGSIFLIGLFVAGTLAVLFVDEHKESELSKISKTSKSSMKS